LPDPKEGKMPTTATQDQGVPIQGYDDLEARRLFAQLRLRSQAELTQIDSYERSHQDRRAVLDKLRYLRIDEPIAGYDGLEADAILAALADADTVKLAAVRGYEVKLRDREEVLTGLVRLRAERMAAQGSGAAPEPAEVWKDADAGFKGGAITALVFALLGVAAILLVVLLCVLVFVVLTAVAPGSLIG
jgi:hypothetical protein